MLAWKTYVVEIGYDQDENGGDHSQCQEVHSNSIRQIIIHCINISREAIRNPTQWCSIEEGHGGSEYSRDSLIEHEFAGSCAENRQREREEEHKKRLTGTQASVYTYICSRLITKFV